jgi:HEAT repeat protein
MSTILCVVPTLVVISHDGTGWLLSSPIERVLRFDGELLARGVKHAWPWLAKDECVLQSDDEPQDEVLDNPRLLDEVWAATASNDINVRRHAYYLVTVLHDTGRISDESVARMLARGLRDPEPMIRKGARVYVWGGPFSDRRGLAINLRYHLVAALADSDDEIRRWAIMALGDLGPEAKFALPDISRALKDKNKDIAQTAQWAVMKIMGIKHWPPANE